jgi:hypothetical protein
MIAEEVTTRTNEPQQLGSNNLDSIRDKSWCPKDSHTKDGVQVSLFEGFGYEVLRADGTSKIKAKAKAKPEGLMTAKEARSTVETIKDSVENIGKLLIELRDREGWRALGYRDGLTKDGTKINS